MKHGSATMTMMCSDFVKSVALFGNNAGTKSFFVSGEKNPAMKVANVSNTCIPKRSAYYEYDFFGILLIILSLYFS